MLKFLLYYKRYLQNWEIELRKLYRHSEIKKTKDTKT